jgi:hypothetical protein
MNSTEIIEAIEAILARLPERVSGNEANEYVVEKLRTFVDTSKESVLDALRSYLAFRISADKRTPEDAVSEARIWTALDVATKLSLAELRPEVESLHSDVLDGKVLNQIDAKSVDRYIKKLG